MLRDRGSWVNSYLSQLSHASSARVISSIFAAFPWLDDFYHCAPAKVSPKYRPASIKSLHDQHNYFSRLLPKYVVLFQTGCYFEAYNDCAQRLSVLTGYRLFPGRRFRQVCGFHSRFLQKVISALEAQRIPYVLLRQTGRELLNSMERLPDRLVDFYEE